MQKVEVIVFAEGQSEEQFIKTIIAPDLRHRNVFVKATLMGGTGGNISYDRLKTHARNQLKSTPNAYLTTLFDYYGLKQDFPDQQTANSLSCIYTKVNFLEQAIQNRIVADIGCSPERFMPHIQPYELEGLFFSDIVQLCSIERHWNGIIQNQLTAVREKFDTPEHINNSIHTAPSKRLELILSDPKYHKIRHTPLIAEAIGLHRIEKECKHFSDWMNKLRGLSPLNQSSSL